MARKRGESHSNRAPQPPHPHPSGARPPDIQRELVPRHIAVVMDGNGRWAKERGLPRTAGHEAGEASLFDCVEGAIELGVGWLSAYAFSTENWKRSPDEVRFLMGFNRDVIRRRRDEMNDLGVRVRWAGRRPKLWRSVINELEEAERLTARNTVLTLTMCVNYGGRAEIADAAAAIARDVRAGKLDPGRIDERMFHRYLDEPDMPDVDLFVRSSGEQRTSNFLVWQSAYAELVFLNALWPDFDRRHLWHACEIYASRDRRYGGAVPNPVPPADDRFFHLTSRAEWDAAVLDGFYRRSTRGKSIDEVGFIHGSTPEQVAEVAGFVYAGTDEDLVLLEMSLTSLEAAGVPVRFEDGGNGKLYPHIYAPLPCELVGRVIPARFNADGEFEFDD